jgi:uncharacterized protein (DUF2141 family)
MLKYLFMISLLLLPAVSGKTLPEEITVHVKAEGLKNNKGMCYLLLFKNKKGFPDSRAQAETVIQKPIEGSSVDFIFNAVAGKSAISVLHDENLNEKMDKTWYGKPVEGFGVSNNPRIGEGPPEFDESAISILNKNTIIHIRMIYLKE